MHFRRQIFFHSRVLRLRTALKSLFLLFPLWLFAQGPGAAPSKINGSLGTDRSVFQTPSFQLSLVKSSQTVAALRPQSDTAFDFTPGERLSKRNANGYYQLGDINLRLRQGSSGEWKSYSTATDRREVEALRVAGTVLAASDLKNTLPTDIPLSIKRFWQLEKGQLVLRFELTNHTSAPVEIGALGIPMIFNNVLEGKSLVQAHAQNVLYDPYIGQDAGYLQVTHLHGGDSSLLVLPYGKTPFEAYNPLNDDPTPRGIPFEGFYEWMVHSKAYAEAEWKAADPWNSPTSVTLKPGESKSYGVRFVPAGKPAAIEKTLLEKNRPVAVGIPGYVLPQDVDGQLFINYKSRITSVKAEPADALSITSAPPARNGWKSYAVRGKKWGRARLTIHYEDGLTQTIHYKVIKPEKQVLADYGNFLTTKQWFDQPDSLFHRSPSIISYDNDAKQQVVQDKRAWIAGLSDEAGAGSWLGAMMKQVVLPSQTEVNKLERFIDETLWGQIQLKEGPGKYGVRKSLFYYAPDSFPAGTYTLPVDMKDWSFWPKKEAYSLGRSYNYPHVAAAHWVMYRLARYHKGLVTAHDWKWYLTNAYGTAIGMMQHAPQFAEFGQMEGTVFYMVLKDLRKEGLTAMADDLEAAMKKRAAHWATLPFPFGSEMPWDSTGQEEVYIWSLFFGYEEKAAVTLDAILAYMPTIPHWAYNGNARRYWDFQFAGKLPRVERMIHHYGSSLNAIPVLTEYRRKPDDFYLLRVGYGGVLGAISNITEEGFAPCAFHSYPNTLKNDGYSGDYGPSFFGYAVNSATYLVQHPDFGWLGFGGNVVRQAQWVQIKPTTANSNAVYIGPAKLWITLAAGKLNGVSYNPSTRQVKLVLDKADAFTPTASIAVEQFGEGLAKYKLKGFTARPNGDYEVPLKQTATEVILER